MPIGIYVVLLNMPTVLEQPQRLACYLVLLDLLTFIVFQKAMAWHAPSHCA